MHSFEFRTLKVEKRGGVLVTTLNRPDALNAINPEMHSELEALLGSLAKEPDVKVLVFTGAGHAFSAGGDLKRMQDRLTMTVDARKREMRTVISGGAHLVQLILDLEIPVIAAVNGPAVGLGATLALFCDIVIASERAKFGDAHVKAGVVAGDGGAVIWPLLVGVSRAKQYLMTGDNITAEKAQQMGLISEVVPADQLMESAMGLANRLAQGPSMAISFTKKAVNKVIKQNASLILDASLAWEESTFFSDDHAEAVNAFCEKRQPRFKGA